MTAITLNRQLRAARRGGGLVPRLHRHQPAPVLPLGHQTGERPVRQAHVGVEEHQDAVAPRAAGRSPSGRPSSCRSSPAAGRVRTAPPRSRTTGRSRRWRSIEWSSTTTTRSVAGRSAGPGPRAARRRLGSSSRAGITMVTPAPARDAGRSEAAGPPARRKRPRAHQPSSQPAVQTTGSSAVTSCPFGRVPSGFVRGEVCRMHRQSPPTLAGPDGFLPRPGRSGEAPRVP